MSGAEIWQHINETLKILLWPAVIAWVFFVLRHKIKDRMGDLESVESPALTARFAKRKDIDVGPAVEEILNRAADEAGSEDDDSQDSETDLLGVREDIEEVIKRSFEEGMAVGRDTFDVTMTKPRIAIEWTGSTPSVTLEERPARLARWLRREPEPSNDPSPTMHLANAMSPAGELLFERMVQAARRISPEVKAGGRIPPVVFEQAKQIAEVEAELDRLTGELDSEFFGRSGPSTMSIHARRSFIRQLETKLGNLDPTSPLIQSEARQTRRMLIDGMSTGGFDEQESS
ncbi:hypothetical protein OG474_30535 [Kribbella sp. NBC_01505]|uniref:hypothetical protein n=1 Tax=Kribbella sp. NBC_01505 TaxID=2903580 RepID=UPI00386AE8DE